MLAMANQNGVVETSIPGLAVLARVPEEKCRHAIICLESPDRDSRSQEFDGRRIQKVDGGWLILNHAKYRKKLSADERREYKTVKQREYRSKTPVDKSGLSSTPWTHTDSEADTDSKENQSTHHRRAYETASFNAFFEAYPVKLDRPEANREWFRIPFVENEAPKIMAGLEKWKRSERWQEAQYVPSPVKFLKGRRWENTPPSGNLKQGPSLEEQRKALEAKIGP